MKLGHGFAFDPNEVLHSRFPESIGAYGHWLGYCLVEFLAHADIELPRNDRHVLCLWVRVRRDSIAVRIA